MSKHTCRAKKDSCSGEVGKPQSEHMKGVVTARQPNQGGNVSNADHDELDMDLMIRRRVGRMRERGGKPQIRIGGQLLIRTETSKLTF